MHPNQISINTELYKPIGALMIFVNNVNDGNKNYIYQESSKTKKVRYKRNMNKKRKHNKHLLLKENNECQRTELYVDFGELNWQDWIMAPSKIKILKKFITFFVFF